MTTAQLPIHPNKRTTIPIWASSKYTYFYPHETNRTDHDIHCNGYHTQSITIRTEIARTICLTFQKITQRKPSNDQISPQQTPDLVRVE